MIQVIWVQPLNLPASYTKTRITRSMEEQGEYALIAEINTIDHSGLPVTSFNDPAGTTESFYVIRYFDPTSMQVYADFSLGFLPFTPREKRILTYVVGWIPNILKPDLTDFDIGYALRLAISDFNVHPPETSYTVSSFPANYEQFLVTGCQVHIILQKYLKVAIRDYSYSDMGYTMTIDRGAKMAKAREDILAIWQNTISMAKWNFTPAGMGVGTVPLPLSLGGNLNPGLLNVLDIATSLIGR